MSVENKHLQENQNTPESIESFNYQKAIEMTKKIHDGMDSKGYNHEQYGINPNTGVVFTNDGKIKILLNEKAQVIDTGFTTNDYATNKYGSFTIFKISKRIRELEIQHKNDIDSLAGNEKSDIINSSKKALLGFINDTLEYGNLAITGIMHKTKKSINDILDNNSVFDKKQEYENKQQVTQTNVVDTKQQVIAQNTKNQNMHTGYAIGQKQFQYKQPVEKPQKPNQAGHALGLY